MLFHKRIKVAAFISFLIIHGCTPPGKTKFSVLAFYSTKSEEAHLSFVREASKWFRDQSSKYSFAFDTTSNWENLNSRFIKNYRIIVFLDTRPESEEQRTAFRDYMENGGAWMGFHFAAFALNNSEVVQNWDWYHNTFLGSGEYKGNTWRPTSAFLRADDKGHPVLKNITEIFKASPNEWYSWQNDLRKNPDINLLLSIDSSSFPVGTGPKPHEIWYNGYYPVAWTNKNFRMIYFNFGHNDLDYEGGTSAPLSFTFGNPVQDRLIINSIFWLARTDLPESASR